MNSSCKTFPGSVVEILIELSPEEWEKYKKKGFQKISSEMKIDGFRKGHVPESVLREKIGESTVLESALDIALPHFYVMALQEHSLSPLAQPEVNVKKTDPLEFSVRIFVYPKVVVNESGIKKNHKKKTAVSKKEIDETVKDFQQRLAEKVPVSRSAKIGDIVEIDFEGFDSEGKPIANTKSQNHPLVLGSKMFIPGFEEALVGVEKGAKKTFNITFPNDYQEKALMGKEVSFTVFVHEVFEQALPEVDEVFVEKLTGQKKTVDDLYKEIESAISEKKEKEDYKERESELLGNIEQKTECEIPHLLIEEEEEVLIDHIRLQGLQSGMTWEVHLKRLGKTEEELKKEIHPHAAKNVKIRLGIQELLRQKNITVDDDTIIHEISHVLSHMPEKEQKKHLDEFRKGQRGWNEAENRLKIKKLIDLYLEES
jgi:trigger factor